MDKKDILKSVKPRICGTGFIIRRDPETKEVLRVETFELNPVSKEKAQAPPGA